MSPAVALLKTIRPHQWVKNVFVAAPLVFARHLTESDYLWRTAIAVLAFSLLSGAVYAFNDVRDVEADRAHPTKKLRPIALGFILRVLAGAYAIDVPASGWLILCTALLATFLGLGKRGHELAWAEKAGGATSSTRAALSGYSLPSLRLAMYVLAAATCAAYVAYTLDAHTIEMFATERLVLSAPFVGLAIVRFLSLALWHPKDESPTEAMLKDPWFLLALVAAVATIVYVIYGHRLGG